MVSLNSTRNVLERILIIYFVDQSIFEELGVTLNKDPGIKLMNNPGKIFSIKQKEIICVLWPVWLF